MMLAFGVLLSSQAAAQSTSGTLKCDVSSGVSFVFGSTRDLSCVYQQSAGRPAETYRGKIEKFGIDIGFVTSGVMLWTVLAPVTESGAGKLSGTYIGASAEVVAGLGLGANALVSTNKISLNPLSLTGAQGLNIAAGVASVTLHYVSTLR